MVGRDHVQCGPSFGVVVVMPVRAVPAAAIGNLLCAEPEQKEILLTGFLRHFDGCPVAGADSQRAVHHELHIARAARLVAGGRDLIGDIGGRDQTLGERDVVVGQEHDFEPAARHRIAIDGGGQVVDEFDDQLGEVVGRCRLACEEKRSRRRFVIGVLSQAVVEFLVGWVWLAFSIKHFIVRLVKGVARKRGRQSRASRSIGTSTCAPLYSAF